MNDQDFTPLASNGSNFLGVIGKSENPKCLMYIFQVRPYLYHFKSSWTLSHMFNLLENMNLLHKYNLLVNMNGKSLVMQKVWNCIDVIWINLNSSLSLKKVNRAIIIVLICSFLKRWFEFQNQWWLIFKVQIEFRLNSFSFVHIMSLEKNELKCLHSILFSLMNHLSVYF